MLIESVRYTWSHCRSRSEHTNGKGISQQRSTFSASQQLEKVDLKVHKILDGSQNIDIEGISFKWSYSDENSIWVLSQLDLYIFF